jgi:hypothetical protein
MNARRHNATTMRQLLVLAILSAFGVACSAEVIRCADAAGNVSYTDKACPAGAKEVGRVAIPEPATPTPEEAEQRRQQQSDDAERASRARQESAATRPLPAPAGPVIIDSRGGGNDNDQRTDSRWSDRGNDPAFADDGYGYPYPGAYGRPPPPRDMRPRIRSCDGSGCRDTLGNRYNRAGQLDRYQTPDGKTCRPVGTTTICR